MSRGPRLLREDVGADVAARGPGGPRGSEGSEELRGPRPPPQDCPPTASRATMGRRHAGLHERVQGDHFALRGGEEVPPVRGRTSGEVHSSRLGSTTGEPEVARSPVRAPRITGELLPHRPQRPGPKTTHRVRYGRHTRYVLQAGHSRGVLALVCARRHQLPGLRELPHREGPHPPPRSLRGPPSSLP